MGKKYFVLQGAALVGEADNNKLEPEKVLEYLKNNIDTVKDALADVIPDDVVLSRLQKDEKLLQSITDRRVTQAIKTYEEKFKSEKLPELLKAELEKINPPETEEQKRIRELEMTLRKTEEEAKRNGLAAKMLKQMPEDMPKASGQVLVELLLSEPSLEEDAATARLKVLQSVIEETAKQIALKKFKDLGRKGEPNVTGGDGSADGGGDLSDEQKMLKEYDELLKAGKTAEAIALKTNYYIKKNS